MSERKELANAALALRGEVDRDSAPANGEENGRIATTGVAAMYSLGAGSRASESQPRIHEDSEQDRDAATNHRHSRKR